LRDQEEGRAARRSKEGEGLNCEFAPRMERTNWDFFNWNGRKKKTKKGETTPGKAKKPKKKKRRKKERRTIRKKKGKGVHERKTFYISSCVNTY